MTDPDPRQRLATSLRARRLGSEPWWQAVEAVPRHRLVPDGWAWLTSDGLNNGHPKPRSEYTDQEWYELAYSNISIVTRMEEGDGTSSSTMPSIVVEMLDFLRVEDGQKVLEVGTGTGYSTALLCHRLGWQNVTSVDIQPDLIEEARERLATMGYQPRLFATNGAEGWPEGAPYDRVIGAVFTWPVPSAWVHQAKPGGRIVAVVPTGVVGLDVGADGSASGHFRNGVFGFMAMQKHTQLTAWDSGPDEGDARCWTHPPSIMGAGGDDLPFALMVHTLLTPHTHWGWDHRTPQNAAEVDLLDFKGSRAKIDAGECWVAEGGPRKLWAEVEALYDQWCQLGAPARERFGLTVAPDGQHTLWLDDPDSEHRWPIPYEGKD